MFSKNRTINYFQPVVKALKSKNVATACTSTTTGLWLEAKAGKAYVVCGARSYRGLHEVYV